VRLGQDDPLALFRGTFAVSEADGIASLLVGAVRRDFELHRDIPWLRFVAFGRPDDVGLVVYKCATWKRLRCARLIHVSDPGVYERYRPLLCNHLLVRHGLLVSRVETRFLAAVPRLAMHEHRGQAKLFLSATLKDGEIRDLYSELVALDI